MQSIKSILVAILLLSLNFVGCSFIGFAIGSNSTNDRAFNRNPQEIALIDSAETITVITKDDITITGELVNFIKLPNDEDKGNLSAISHLYVRVNANSVILTFPLEDVKEIIINESNYNWLVGLLVGVTIDVLVIYQIKYEIENWTF